MPIEFGETRLPGIGVKYGFRLDAAGRIVRRLSPNTLPR